MMIVAEDQATYVKEILQKEQCYITEIGSNGDFLQYGETVLMVGVKKEKAEDIMKVFKNLTLELEKKIKIFSIPAERILTESNIKYVK